ncbi:hypothetical protein F2Q69_00007151 [Brassica cretica]|uniref:Uncharacterized protein n=1 Tax=Brassica cretica TaxID=69181 RepID=A0A8S9P2P8_BRACR|nr:hypothetical protein F2Q69_00007151 [Brassica cretica]
MPSSTKSNKDKHLLFSEDPAHLERTIRKDQRSTSLDAAAFASTDSRTQPSTDIRPSSSTDLDQSRNMVAIVILRQDENGSLYDQDGHLRNATGQKLDAQGNTGDTVKRQEALAREAAVEKAKHHVSAIIDDDFWQMVKHEKLGEGNFKVESSMSFGGSHWCQPMSMDTHCSTDHDEDRSTDYSKHRSTPPPKPLANPPESTTNPSDTTPEPMQVDEATEGRRSRKRKEKIPKNLKREANEKEMDGFTKRVLRIPPLDRGYNELFRSMAEMWTEIESMQHNLEKEAMTSPSIDANKSTSIDVKQQTSQIPAEPESLAEKKDEWEIAYINTRINDVYNPLNNNVDWLGTRIDLLQQDLDTIRKKDPQQATSIDFCTITSIDNKFAAMEDRLQTYEDTHDRFTSPIMRYLDTLSTQMMNVQRDIGKHNDQHNFQEEDTMEERLEKRCDDIYFPFDVRLGGLDSQAEWLQKEVKAIQRKLASQHQISASTDKHLAASIDTTVSTKTELSTSSSSALVESSTPDDEQLIQNKMEAMHEELNELSAYAYDKIG